MAHASDGPYSHMPFTGHRPAIPIINHFHHWLATPTLQPDTKKAPPLHH